MSDTFKHAGYKIRIKQDPDAESPREDENLGTIVGWHRRYNLGDEQPTCNPSEFMEGLARDADDELEEIESRVEDIENYFYRYEQPTRLAERIATQYLKQKQDQALEDNYIILPVYMYEHSGIALSTGSFSCPWDSGQVGYIYVSKEKVIEEYGDWTAETVAKASKQLENEVETYSQFVNGEVYGFIIEDKDGEYVDSCWGFFGYDFCLEEAKQAADYARKQADELELSNATSGMHI
jgi:hypothetical protein